VGGVERMFFQDGEGAMPPWLQIFFSYVGIFMVLLKSQDSEFRAEHNALVFFSAYRCSRTLLLYLRSDHHSRDHPAEYFMVINVDLFNFMAWY
jgi:hypothetical protein